jgi:hypothetical protein
MGNARLKMAANRGRGLAMIALLNFYVLIALLCAFGIWSAVSLLLH